MYHFVRITPTNFPYALWLSLRTRVAAWKLEVPERFAGRFERVRPYRLWSRDEWLLAHDRAFDLWKARALPLLVQRYRHTARLPGGEADFSRNLWQLLGMEFEALCLFVSMLEKESAAGAESPCVVAPRIAAAFSDDELEGLFPGVRIMRSAGNRLLENLHEWIVSAAHLGRQVAYLGMSIGGKSKILGRRAIAWLGISPQEITDREDQLDFAWAARYGHVPAGDVAYFVPQDLTTSQRAFYDARGIAYVEPADSFAVLPMETRLRVIGGALAGFLAALRLPGAIAPLAARMMARAPYWDALFTELGTTTYVTTTSYSWPEKPELAITCARGIRSIIWSYSANSLSFSLESPAVRDVGVARSLVIADEFWVWNDAFAEWLAKRRTRATPHACDVRVVGPLMCGDSGWLSCDRREARQRLELPAAGLCIGVFDMSPVAESWRDRFGGGPAMVDMETYVAFWKLIERVLSRVPGSFALVKLKRGLTHQYRDYPAIVRELLDEEGEHIKSGRLISVDVDIDPYLPVAACDIAFGIAYTSPVLAALTAHRPGYYVDPLGRARFPPHPGYGSITISTQDEAVAAVLRARDAKSLPPIIPQAVTPPPCVVPLHERHEPAPEFDDARVIS